MPVRSVFCRLVFWVLGASSVSFSESVSVVASPSIVLLDRWARCSRESASRFFPLLWLIACLVVVINRVILGCDGAFCLCPTAPSVASVRALFLIFLCCHCLVIASQCLAVCLSCRAFHCCRPMLSDAVGIAFSPLAAAGRVSCVGRVAPFVFMCALRCDRVPRLGDSRPAWGVVSVVRVSLCRDVVSPSYFVCGSS